MSYNQLTASEHTSIFAALLFINFNPRCSHVPFLRHFWHVVDGDALEEAAEDQAPRWRFIANSRQKYNRIIDVVNWRWKTVTWSNGFSLSYDDAESLAKGDRVCCKTPSSDYREVARCDMKVESVEGCWKDSQGYVPHSTSFSLPVHVHVLALCLCVQSISCCFAYIREGYYSLFVKIVDEFKHGK